MQAVLEALMCRTEGDIPWAPVKPGAWMRVPHADVEADLFVLNSRLSPGYETARHRHSGEVFAITVKGRWGYLEHGDLIEAGDYLYEPKGSVHTLKVPEDNEGDTEFWAIVHGALEYVDDRGEVVAVLDATAALAMYQDACRSAGLSAVPPIHLPSSF